jgi:glucan phosphorylase
MAPEFSALYTKYLGDWEENLTNHDFWRGVIDIPDAQLWETHQKLKLRLVEFVRERVRIRRTRIGESPEALRRVNQILDPEILTIGFARRFATYKRGALLFSDKERLSRLLHDTSRPVQFIFAGKSHPRDEGGKALIQQVYKFSREAGPREPDRLRRRLRYLHCATARAGRRSLAQQSAPTTGGERHQRHEVATEWRPQPERARWLVVRKLQRQERLGDRSGDH